MYPRSTDEVSHERGALLSPQRPPFRLTSSLDAIIILIDSALEPPVRGGRRAPLLSHGRRLPLALRASTVSTARGRARRSPYTGHVTWVAVVGEAAAASVVSAGGGSGGPRARVVSCPSAVVAEALWRRVRFQRQACNKRGSASRRTASTGGGLDWSFLGGVEGGS